MTGSIHASCLCRTRPYWRIWKATASRKLAVWRWFTKTAINSILDLSGNRWSRPNSVVGNPLRARHVGLAHATLHEDHQESPHGFAGVGEGEIGRMDERAGEVHRGFDL